MPITAKPFDVFTPTSYGIGPYYPAIRDSVGKVYVWWSVIKASEDEALDYAARAVNDCYEYAREVWKNWNVEKV